MFRGLHIIFTCFEDTEDLSWIKDFGIVETSATHTGCDRGGLHTHVLLLAHFRNDRSIL